MYVRCRERVGYIKCGKRRVTYGRHLEVTKFVPEVFHGVCADKSSNKETNPFDATYTADRPAGHGEPDPPVNGKGPARRQSRCIIDARVYLLVLLVSKLGETEHSCKCKKE